MNTKSVNRRTFLRGTGGVLLALPHLNLMADNFKGKVLYAVKANPQEFIIKLLAKNGLKSFDVASLNEIKLIKNILPQSEIYFMNPIKSRNAIKESYFKYRVKNFTIDNFYEFEKIKEETKSSKDINLFIRLSVPNTFSKINLSNKFGINEKEALILLKKLKKENYRTGISFNVGSQCMNPKAYEAGIRKVKKVLQKSNINIDFLNIGGGFPSEYNDHESFSLKTFINKINDSLRHFFPTNINLLSEPGRSIVSDCMSFVVRINLRKKNKLFINDGIHGHLNNAGYRKFSYPVKLFNRIDKNSIIKPFSLFGPTCDSGDFIKGPFFLPNSIKEGDWIEFSQMGAYTITMQTNFNGFYNDPSIFRVR